jgi:hypothetical protein
MTTRVRKIDDVLNLAEKMFGFSKQDILGKSRKSEVVLVRHACQALCNKYKFPEACTLKSIGSYFGGRDHSTIIHAARAVQESLEDPRNNPRLRVVYNALLLECEFCQSKVLKTELSIYGISNIIRQYEKLRPLSHIQRLMEIKRRLAI